MAPEASLASGGNSAIPLNQLTTERVLGGGAIYYTWTADGEMETKQEAAGWTYYTWDVDESLSEILWSIEPGTEEMTNAYDADMKRGGAPRKSEGTLRGVPSLCVGLRPTLRDTPRLALRSLLVRSSLWNYRVFPHQPLASTGTFALATCPLKTSLAVTVHCPEGSLRTRGTE